jgi:hypothetical protein
MRVHELTEGNDDLKKQVVDMVLRLADSLQLPDGFAITNCDLTIHSATSDRVSVLLFTNDGVHDEPELGMKLLTRTAPKLEQLSTAGIAVKFNFATVAEVAQDRVEFCTRFSFTLSAPVAKSQVINITRAANTALFDGQLSQSSHEAD